MRIILRRTQNIQRFLKRLCVLVVTGACLIQAACTSLDPAQDHGANGSYNPPFNAPRTTGFITNDARERERLMSIFGGRYHAPALESYLNGLANRLLTAAKTQDTALDLSSIQITILNAPVVNAFALPSGEIFVTRGLLALANDSDEIAAVLAHELAHVTARHAAQRAEIERKAELVSRVATDLLEAPDTSRTYVEKMQRTLIGFSRQQEFEADKIGITTMTAAGFDPFAAARFLHQLQRATSGPATASSGNTKRASQPDLSSTHPATEERITAALKLAKNLTNDQQSLTQTKDSRLDFLLQLNGLLYGDDPDEGFVRGRYFVHPKLGFAFAAPEGFVLQNSSQLLLGANGDGTQALRIDNVALDEATKPEIYLTSGWIDGLDQASITSLMQGSLTGATAKAHGEDWFFRIAVIRLAGQTYRIIFAAKNEDTGIDQQFLNAIDSFHRLSVDEAASVHAARLSLAIAKAGDTPQRMAEGLTGQGRKLETFLLLNGLKANMPLETGQTYKIIVD